jgi:hypothetical protein
MIEYTVKVDDNGNTEWYLNGVLHRADGPAVEWSTGANTWYLNGKKHRADGPAVEFSNGAKTWYLNGVLHREDGPAVEYPSGTKEWYLNGNEYTHEEFLKKTQPVKEITEPDGSEYINKIISNIQSGYTTILYYLKKSSEVSEDLYEPVSKENWKLLRELGKTDTSSYNEYVALKQKQLSEAIENFKQFKLSHISIPGNFTPSQVLDEINSLESDPLFVEWPKNQKGVVSYLKENPDKIRI